MERLPALYTERLILRKINIDDVDALVKYANNKKISDQILNIPYPYREPDAVFRISYVVKGFKNKSRYIYAIVSRERNELIGEISLHFMNSHQNHAQLGYWVGEPFWNTGIATEATEAVLKFGFEKLKTELIYGTCLMTNVASEKVMSKNGMVKHNVMETEVVYRITQEEFMNTKVAN